MNVTICPDWTDEQRLAEIVRHHREALQAYALRLVDGDIGRAEDVVQETFVRAWLRIGRLTPEHGPVYGWLRRVTYNVAMDGHRMRRARPEEVELLTTDFADHQGVDHVDGTLTAITVAQLLESLWPEHRAVLVEIYLHDRTAVQTAAVLGVPVGTVKSRLHYALRLLRKILDEAAL